MARLVPSRHVHLLGFPSPDSASLSPTTAGLALAPGGGHRLAQVWAGGDVRLTLAGRAILSFRWIGCGLQLRLAVLHFGVTGASRTAICPVRLVPLIWRPTRRAWVARQLAPVQRLAVVAAHHLSSLGRCGVAAHRWLILRRGSRSGASSAERPWHPSVHGCRGRGRRRASGLGLARLFRRIACGRRRRRPAGAFRRATRLRMSLRIRTLRGRRCGCGRSPRAARARVRRGRLSAPHGTSGPRAVFGHPLGPRLGRPGPLAAGGCRGLASLLHAALVLTPPGRHQASAQRGVQRRAGRGIVCAPWHLAWRCP